MMKKRIFSLTLALCLLLSLLPGTAWAADDHKHNVCGGTSCSHDGHNEVTFTALSSITDNKLTAGSYYLSGNIENVSTTIEVSGTVNLCLNGKTISGTASPLIQVEGSDAVLNICDCQGNGKVNNNGTTSDSSTTGECLGIQNNGTANLYGGTFTQACNSSTVRVGYAGTGSSSSGNLTIDGATLENSGSGKAYALSVSHGIATLKSGKLNSSSGAGVYVAFSDTQFHMTGGFIETQGWGIYNNGATMEITGGTITSPSNGIQSFSGSVTVKGDAVVKSTATSKTDSATPAGINATGGTVAVEGNAKVEGFVGVLAGENVTKLEITGGTITGTGSGGDGNGVDTKAQSTAISGGAITGEYAGVYAHGGTTTITGGTMKGSCGIYVPSSTSTDVKVEVGGAAEVTAETYNGIEALGGTVTITGGTITGGSTSNYSGVRVASSGVLNITGGTITGPSGTGVSIASSNATISGAVNITGKTSGVKVNSGGALTVKDTPTITATAGNGIEVATGGKLTVTGGTIISSGNGITNNGTTTIPGGSTVTVEKGGTSATVTVPAGGSDGTVDKDGIMNLPSNSTVTIGGTKVTLPDGGTVDPATGDVTPSNDGKVTITDSSGKTTTITPPSGGKVTVGGDGKISVPDGSKVQTGDGPEITVGSGNGGTVDPATGGVTVPNGGKVTIKDDQGNSTTITPPNGGEVKPGADGGVVAPGGSTVTHTDSSGATTSGTVPSGGGTVKPDGSVEGDTPAPGGDKLTDGETVNLTGGGTVKREGDTVTITPSGGGDPTTITVPAGGEVTVDKDTGEVTVPDNSKVKTGDNGTEITLPSGGTVKPGGEVTPAPGGTVTITDDKGNTTTITPPSGESVEPAVDGGVDVPEGTTIQTGSGPVITLPETGEGGTVKPGGEVVGSPVQVGGNTVTVSKTDPTQGDIATDSSGNVTLPGGTTATVEDKDGNKTTVTVPSGGSGTVSKDGDITLPSGGTVTVPGKDGGTTEITVPSGGGTVEKNSDGTLTAPAGSEITNKDKNGQQVGDKVTVPSGGQTVIPGGEPAPVNYTVTFQANGGSAVAAQTVSKGKTATEPTAPTREGYTFKGWYADAEFNAPWDFATVLTGDRTLYAKWEKNPVIYTVTFDANGGTPAPENQPVAEGKLIDKPDPSPTLSGHTFLGWTVTKDGSDFWQFKTDVVTKNVTLYAKWEANGTGTEVKPGDSAITTDDGTKVEVKDDGTVTITPPSSEEGDKPTTVTPPSSGDNVTVDEQGKVNVPGGSTVTVPDGNDGKTEITVPQGGSSTIKPTNDGRVEVPEGSTVTTQDGTKITVTDGDKPVVKPDGEITLPGGGTVAIPDGTGGKTEITVPSGGTVKPTDDGRVEVPQGSEVKTNDGTKITVTTGTDAVVKPDGTVTIPGGGTVTITTPNGKTETVTVPTGGTVDPEDYGKPAPGPAPSYGGDDDDDEPTYRPTVEKTSHGTVTVRPSEPEQGDRVTITVKPDKGYEVEDVTVTDRNGDPVKVKDNGNGTYTFTQPKGKVSVEATFRAVQTPQPVQPAGDWSDCRHDAACLIHAYTDADPGAWYHDGVHYCLQNGLMNGFTDGTFKPDATLSRAQLAQILYNLEGRPALNGASPFTDVANNAWCASAVIWANQNGIVGGYGNGLFGPNNPITREQLATMLWRYAKAKGYDVSVGENTNILGYNDFSKIHEYAIPALQWATGAGVMNGKGGGILDPIGRATRAQTAVMLQRYLENATH